jgi:hypothetical protein
MSGDSIRKRIEALEARRNTGLEPPQFLIRFVHAADGRMAARQPKERYRFDANGDLELIPKGELE